MNHEEIIRRLREPFDAKEIEWKIQVTSQDKSRGMAVAYLDARAVQRRLDEVVGAFNWKNVYSLWHNNSQICGISIFFAERNEWVTKFDGAENSDIEPIKGGLSDSFKRAASAWGVGRYLYETDSVWVELENKGKSSVIKQNQLGKLETAYNNAVRKICGTAPTAKQKPAPMFSKPASPAQSAQPPAPASPVQWVQPPENEFKVQSIKPSGKSSQLVELVKDNGETVSAYIKIGDHTITAGARLRGVQIEKKNGKYGEYNLITDYAA